MKTKNKTRINLLKQKKKLKEITKTNTKKQ